MIPRVKRSRQTSAPVVSPATAEAVFGEWADLFEIDSGWFSHNPRFDQRHRANVRFSRGADGYVYFAVAPTGPIKIGLSGQPLNRVRSFPGYEILVAISEQDASGESSIHDELKDFRRPHRELTYLHGVKHEWFTRESVLVSLIYRLRNAATSQLSIAAVGAA